MCLHAGQYVIMDWDLWICLFSGRGDCTCFNASSELTVLRFHDACAIYNDSEEYGLQSQSLATVSSKACGMMATLCMCFLKKNLNMHGIKLSLLTQYYFGDISVPDQRLSPS